jgi:exosome complex protein LRP1
MSKQVTSSAGALPNDIQACLDSFGSALDQVQAALGPFLSSNVADMTADLPPAEKAKLQLLLAYSCNALFYMYLKTQGANVQQHPVSSELNRVKEYFAKLKSASEKPIAGVAAASGPVLRIDKEASKRVVKHALPRQEAKGADKKKRVGEEDSSGSDSESDGGKANSKPGKKGKAASAADKSKAASSKRNKKQEKGKGVEKKDKKQKKQKKKSQKKDKK